MIAHAIARDTKRKEPGSAANHGPSSLPWSQMVRRSRVYALAAESSYILRWLVLKCIGLLMKLAPMPRWRRERVVLAVGNALFSPTFSPEIFASRESYVAQMDSGLDLYLRLLPKEHWLCDREILDLGSGLGQYSQELLKCGASSVTGLEYQQDKAIWSASRFASPRLRFTVGSAEAMPFEKGTFDTVFSHTVFEHLNDVEAALHEVRRVLRPGGWILLSYNFFHHRGGHHLFPYIHFPWAPWVVSESTLCRYWSEQLARDQQRGGMRFYPTNAQVRSLSEGAEIHLNQLTVDEFEAMLEKVALRIVRRQSSEELASLFPILQRVPGIGRFLTGTVYYVLQPAV